MNTQTLSSPLYLSLLLGDQTYKKRDITSYGTYSTKLALRDTKLIMTGGL